ncbi:MAG: ribosome-binding factor A [Gammaproteobacteria bacterium]|nr:ribosome-binding factor A [Gammaproteobacteria bacterium]|tara:strand:+ start:119 stop:466 length:348 start_codon:yes stop_codon:yes gene_type:complete
MSSNRTYKISDLLRKEISTIILKEIKDPRLQNINITAVKVSDDIGIATVFYTLIGQSIKKEESNINHQVLKKLSGMLRSKLAKKIKIRRVPKIIFKFDESIEYSQNIETLLKNLK